MLTCKLLAGTLPEKIWCRVVDKFKGVGARMAMIKKENIVMCSTCPHYRNTYRVYFTIARKYEGLNGCSREAMCPHGPILEYYLVACILVLNKPRVACVQPYASVDGLVGSD